VTEGARVHHKMGFGPEVRSTILPAAGAESVGLWGGCAIGFITVRTAPLYHTGDRLAMRRVRIFAYLHWRDHSLR
jgi:hypothetical protein